MENKKPPVSQRFIVLACTKFHHPSTRTAQLYLEDPDLSTQNIFRTDRGDDEGPDEWVFKKKAGCTDDYNDDNIQVQLFSNHTFRVYYMNVVDGPCKN